MLPHDLPPCRIVFHYYRVWQQDGAWRQVNDALCQQTRQQQGCHPEPSSAIMDSPVKTTGGEPWPRCRPESDGAQGVIKRRTPRGLLLEVVVHPADVQGRDGFPGCG